MALSALPYAMRGPGYVLDDWFLLANAHFDGWSHALSGELLRARPGSGAVYAISFGLVGRHPAVAFALDLVLVAVAAVLVFELLRRFVPRPLAFATAALWAVLPNHTSLTHWATASAITVALVLLLGGLVLLADERPLPLVAALLGASVLCYEATAPAAVAGLVAIPVLQRRSWVRPLVVGAAVLVPVGAYMAASLPSVKRGLGQVADLGLVAPAHVGWGVLPTGIAEVAGRAFALCVLAAMLAVSARRRQLTAEAGLALAGIVVIVLGTLPFLRYFYAPLGAGDRVQVVAGVGTAMVWAGLLGWLHRELPAPIVATVAVVVVAGMAVAGWQRSHSWADAADDADRILAALPPPHDRETITIERPPLRRNVGAFLDLSNIASAVQLERGTRAVTVRLVVRPAR